MASTTLTSDSVGTTRVRRKPTLLSRVGVEDLDRNVALVLAIQCEVHRGHATTSELSLERISFGEGGPQRVNAVAHRRLVCVADHRSSSLSSSTRPIFRAKTPLSS